VRYGFPVDQPIFKIFPVLSAGRMVHVGNRRGSHGEGVPAVDRGSETIQSRNCRRCCAIAVTTNPGRAGPMGGPQEQCCDRIKWGPYTHEKIKGAHNEISLKAQGCKRDCMVRRHMCFRSRGISDGDGGTCGVLPRICSFIHLFIYVRTSQRYKMKRAKSGFGSNEWIHLRLGNEAQARPAISQTQLSPNGLGDLPPEILNY
jgi:hypothetical protein